MRSTSMATPGRLTPFRELSFPPETTVATTDSPSTRSTRHSIRPSSRRTVSPGPAAAIEWVSPDALGVASSPSTKVTLGPGRERDRLVEFGGPDLRPLQVHHHRGVVVSLSTARARSMTSSRWAVVPWLAFSRTTDIPASARSRIGSRPGCPTRDRSYRRSWRFAYRRIWRRRKKPHG